uniref:Cordon-bleu WH2 repeat protein n=1 Tax=Malurus cyaneus samueli TaxID=2593467 RepID=A0A8C5T175_9PASS
GVQNHNLLLKRMKARAPPPPNQPPAASRIPSEPKSPAETAVIADQNLVSMKENMINRLVDFTVVLPSGVEQKCTVQGSKAVMDVLVDLCSQYRLNPSQHSLELKSSGAQQVLSYKPNTLIGALDVQTVLLKEKIPEEKAKRPLPRVPEKSVRLVVNYLKTQKAVVRVSPEVPLHNIIPTICEKCEVSQEHIVLLRDGITGEELELTKSLEELGIKELYAWDRKKGEPRLKIVTAELYDVTTILWGFSTAPNSPSANSRSSSLGSSLSLGNISGMTANPEVKKRRAPPPPVATAVLPNAEVRGQERTAAQSPLSARDNVYVVDDTVLELSEVEETASESSCFASEDTTEDSGVVSSPSDIVSLDSQNDSVRLRDIKLVNGYTEPVEVDTMCGVETSPMRSACCDDKAMALARHENGDTFIAAQLQQTLADLDEDLEGRKVCVTLEIQNTETLLGDAESNWALGTPVSGSVNTGNFTNRNNNAGSFDKGHTDGGAVYISKDLIYQQPSENDFSHWPVEQRRDIFESLTSSFEKRSEKNLRLELSPKHGMKSEECKSKLSPSHSRATIEISTAKEKLSPFNECSIRERSLKKSKSELEIKWPPAKKTEVEEVPSTPTWCHRAQNSGSSYEPKMGLTTFKVVPPKPEVRHFDRGVSLSTGAIKIDELGNLIGPNTSVSKHVQGSSSDESEEIHIGKVKAFWRSSSMDKQSDDSAEHFPKKSGVTANSKPFTVKHEHKPVSPAAPKPTAPQTVTNQAAERQSENERTKPTPTVPQSQVTPSAAPAINKDKLDLPFVKPHRRTSSQYVASAIARHINQGVGEVKNEAEVSPKRCIIVAKYSPVETESTETRETFSSTFACSQKASHRFTPGDNSGMENKVVNIRAPNQAPLNFYKKNASVPLTKSSSKDNNSAEDDHGLNSKQSIAEKKTRLAFDQKCETVSHTNSASSLRSPDLQGAPSSFSTSLRVTKWPPANGVQVNSSLKASPELNGAAANAESEQEEKPDDSDTNTVSELDVNVQTNIFGPKKKFKPVVQKPVPKDTSLHSALMEAIQTAGGKEKLRKVNALNGNHRKPSYTEPENERSALLAAIRGHNGSKLKKVRNQDGSVHRRHQMFIIFMFSWGLFVELQNGFAWKGLQHYLVPTPLPWAGTSPVRPGCSKSHPTMGHPQFLWAESCSLGICSKINVFALPTICIQSQLHAGASSYLLFIC